jgi:hypothetical protein
MIRLYLNNLIQSTPIQTTFKRALLTQNQTSNLIRTILYGQNRPIQRPQIPLSHRFDSTKQSLKKLEMDILHFAKTILYGKNGAMQKPMIEGESTYEKALRFSFDTDRSRLYKILPQLTEAQRFDFAKKEVETTEGITDCCNFVRYNLEKYDLSEENHRALLAELDSKSRGHASKIARN